MLLLKGLLMHGCTVPLSDLNQLFRPASKPTGRVIGKLLPTAAPYRAGIAWEALVYIRTSLLVEFKVVYIGDLRN